jgi:hypothetical protein
MPEASLVADQHLGGGDRLFAHEASEPRRKSAAEIVVGGSPACRN